MYELRLSTASVGLLGYGEVGTIFASALLQRGARHVSTWDLKFADPALGEPERANAAGLEACGSAAEIAQHSDVLFSAVTASQTLAATKECAPHMRRDALFIDLNSASPEAKRHAAALIEAAGARYVEAAVMASVPPHGLRVPILLGGPHAGGCAGVLREWGMDVDVASDRLGVASAIKMCRSVIIKGLEAIVIESFTAARAYGVEDAVLASLEETFPDFDWERQADYIFERVIRHGRRRAEEMREATATVADVAIEGHMAAAAAARQGWIAELAAEGAFASENSTWRRRADEALLKLGGALRRARGNAG